MRYASVCSGVEAASLAWMPLGWEAVFFAEIEPFPCAVLKERFPGVPNLGDMTEIKGEKYHGTVDLLVGGTPCQGFSVAGKQGGLNDSRSALCLAYCGLLETMRPRWFVWENVPGVFSTNQGDDFRAFLGKIDEIGYSVAWRVLDAQYVRVDGYARAVPQRRRRVFVVGHLGGDWRYPASVLFEPLCLPGDTPPRRIKGAGVAADAKGSIRETGEGVARSLTSSTGGASRKEQQDTFISGDGRPVNAICRANDMANAETGVNVGTTLLARQYKSPPFVCAGFSGGQGVKAGGIGYEDEVAPTIRSAESGSNQVPDVVCHENHDAPIAFRWAASPTKGLPIGVDYCHTLMANRNGEPAVCYENHAQDSRIKPVEVFQSIVARMGTGGGNLPLVKEPDVIGFIKNDLRCLWEQFQLGHPSQGQELAQQFTAELNLRLSQLPHEIASVATVRRLLPIETERLMGFPDNWTRIPWRGKPEEKCPDGPRYKACGNSMCVNVMRWIGMRIENVERRMKGVENE